MVDGLKTSVMELAGDVDFSKLKVAADTRPVETAMPNTAEGLAAKVAGAILAANPVEPNRQREQQRRSDPPKHEPIKKTYTETYFVYGTHAQCGYEIMLVRVREIDSRKTFSPLMRVYPRYRLGMELSKEREVVIRHYRRARSFRFINGPESEFSVDRRAAVCRDTLLWNEVTSDHRALLGCSPEAWERLFQKLFSSFSELTSKKKAS